MRKKALLKHRNFLCTLMLMCFSCLISSCISVKNEPIHANYYDLGNPQPIEINGVNLEIVPFSNYSEVNSEMLYRLGENQVDLDPYNQWVEPPNILLTSFFKRAINLNDDKKLGNDADILLMSLYVSITAFDIDLKNNKVIIGATYKIRYQGKILLVQNRVFEQSFKDKTPSSFAHTMSLASSEFLKLIGSQINDLKAIIIKTKDLQAK